MVTDIGEFELHRLIRSWIGPHHTRTVLGAGDDAAVLSIPNGYDVVVNTDASSPMRSTDMTDAHYNARQCVIRNFSDILAMGGKPIAFLLALRIRRDTMISYVKTVVQAASEEATHYDAALVGGDTKEHDETLIDGTAIGVVQRDRVLARSGAQIGDIVAITLSQGTRLGARWAHEIILDSPTLSAKFQDYLAMNYKMRHLRLPYREMLSATKSRCVTSAIDTSDGILACLALVGSASGVAFRLREDQLESVVHPAVLPIATAIGQKSIKFLFSMGHEWECVLTIDSRRFASVREEVREVGGDLAPLGLVVEGNGETYLQAKDGSVQEICPFTGEKFTRKPYADHIQLWHETRIV
jgi:thiamine-monophosphate kinase